MKYILFITVACTMVSCESCVPDDCERPISGGGVVPYIFEVPLFIEPAKEKYQVGDTIRMHATFSNWVYERYTQQEYLLEDREFRSFFQIIKIDTFPALGGRAIADYTIDDIYNSGFVPHSQTPESLNFQFLQEDDKYKYDFQMVLKEKGIICLRQGTWFMGDYIEFPGQCGQTSSLANLKSETLTDKKAYLLEHCQDEYIKELLSAKIEKFGIYCFEVE